MLKLNPEEKGTTMTAVILGKFKYVCMIFPLQPQYLEQFHTVINGAKSRKYQGVFEVKSRVKTWQIRGIWSQQLEH